MSITNRISRIARAYVESAKESISESFDIKELGEDLLNRLGGLTGSIRTTNRNSYSEMSDEEIDSLLNSDLSFDYKNDRSEQKARKPDKKQALKDSFTRLGLSSSASLAEAEKAYRREIRKYHPDHFTNDPQKAAMATKVAQMLSEAIENIRQHKK